MTRGRPGVIGDFSLGARLGLAGGRAARIRALMTAVGVGLGVAVLLLAASVPTMLAHGQARSDARTPAGNAVELERGAGTFLFAMSDTRFHDVDVRGRDLRAEGPQAPPPPGVRRIPRPGEIVVSPRLAQLLRGRDGALLQQRLGARVTGTIGAAGLHGPAEAAFYRGAADLRADGIGANAQRAAAYGASTRGDPLGPLLTLLVAVALVVLLLPIAVFVAAAVRFGGEDRDRRLAALRLVGADRATTARVAAGETLLGAGLGLIVGAAVFLGARPLIEHLSLQRLSFFAVDVRPSTVLTLLILVAVPLSAVVVCLLALRGVAIEPLGVVRRSTPVRRRLSWRLAPGAVGVLVVLALRGHLADPGADVQAAAGVFLVLLGVTALLPWVVEAAVRRARGGPLSWQLATRRLQTDGGTAARVVSGIAVAVAGAIALQTVFTAAERQSTSDTGADLSRAGVVVDVGSAPAVPSAGAFARRLRALDGVVAAQAVRSVFAQGADDSADVTVGSCAALRTLAGIGRCRDGDVFLPADRAMARLQPGTRLRLGDVGPGRPAPVWTVPASARRVALQSDPTGGPVDGVLATDGALDLAKVQAPRLRAFVRATAGDATAVEGLRNVAATLGRTATVTEIDESRQYSPFVTVRRGIFAGAVAVLVLIGASLLVGALEQLRERRRVLAVLVAFGTRRSTMATSVLWQAAVPVVLGIAVSVAVGALLGGLLLSVAGQAIVFDWAAIALMAAAGAAVVLAVTLLSMPALWRLMRPDGLRTE